MRVKLLVGLAVLIAVVLPAQAKAGSFVGVVVAKQSQHGTLVLAGARGTGMTVLSKARVRLGDRVRAVGTTSRGDLKASKVTKLAHVTRVKIRGTVVRRLAGATLLSTGHSVIRIRTAASRRVSSANDHGHDIEPGDVVEVDVDIDEDVLVQNNAPVQIGQSSTVHIEGEIVTTTPFVVSIEGLPVTITVPAGVTLPPGLAAGQEIELTVQVGAANVFTLVSIEAQNEDEQGDNDNEVEVRGTVVSSTATSIVISSGGKTFTFVAPTGVTLPTIPANTVVEAKGIEKNGVITLTRLRTGHGDDGGHGGGGGGGGDDD